MGTPGPSRRCAEGRERGHSRAEQVAIQDIYNSAKSLTYGSANWDQFYVMVKARVRSAIQKAVEARDLEYTTAIMGAPGTGPMTPEKARLTLDEMKVVWTEEAVEAEREACGKEAARHRIGLDAAEAIRSRAGMRE